MNFFLMVFLNLAISYFLASRNKQKRTTISPLAIDNSGVPIADESSNYPLSYGTVEITQPNCTWYGDYNTFKIYKKVKTEGGFLGLGSSTEKVEAANGYRIGFIMSLGYGTQNLRAIKVEDKYLFNTTQNGNFEATIDQKNFFGEYENEGGLSGTFRFYSGSNTQPSDSYFTAKVGRDVPNYPNKSYIMFENFYIGNQNSLRQMSFVTKTIPHYDFLDLNKADIGGSCNPANIISDVLLSPTHGANIPLNKINTQSFINAQNKLYEEEFGLSFTHYDDVTVNQIKNSVLQVIDGGLRMQRSDGKLELKLNRQDYDINTIFTLNDDNIMSVKKYSTNSTIECVTEYKLTFVDINDDFKKKIIPFYNEAKYTENNQAISKTEDYLSVTSEKIARMLVLRNALPLTQQFIKMTLTVAELPLNIDFGDVVAIEIPRYKIKRMPMRITEINFGDCKDTTITISLQQDLFAPVLYTNTSNTSYWQAVDYSAKDVDLKLIEAPYALSSNASTSVNKQEVIAMAKNTTNAMLGYTLFTPTDQAVATASGFTPTTKLYTAIGKSDEMIVLTNDSTLSVLSNETETNIRKGFNIALITEGSKQEFVGFTTISSNILSNVKRGLFDTIPESFSVNAEIRFYTYGFAQTSNINYSIGTTASLKAQTRTAREELPLTSATVKSLSVDNRQEKPILPSNLKINNIIYNDTITIGLTDLINISYSFRNKQKDFVQFYSDIENNNTDNNSFLIRFYKTSDNTLIKEETITTNTYTFSDEDTFNNGNLFTQVRLEITAKKGNIESLNKYIIIINRA